MQKPKHVGELCEYVQLFLWMISSVPDYRSEITRVWNIMEAEYKKYGKHTKNYTKRINISELRCKIEDSRIYVKFRKNTEYD